ncbi:hypothetical protein Tco_1470348, partial [Tanacetum coccineum]
MFAEASSVKLTDELVQTDAKLSDQALVVRNLQNELALERTKSQGYKDAADGLKADIIWFVGFDVGCLVRKLLSSDEFIAALARFLTLGITFNVSNFFVGAEAEFNKALAVFPSTLFPFLKKVNAAAGSSLSEVSKILPDRIARLATSVPSVPPATCEALNQAPAEHAPND